MAGMRTSPPVDADCPSVHSRPHNQTAWPCYRTRARETRRNPSIGDGEI